MVDASLTVNPDGRAVIAFSDNGPGFADDQLSRPFLPYFTSKAKGSGLGLPIVKKLIDARRGNISLANREGGGAVVTVSLPPAPPEAARGGLEHRP
jgi:nitrogen fixation/metabolism regulation signal transduction histidine kinase